MVLLTGTVAAITSSNVSVEIKGTLTSYADSYNVSLYESSSSSGGSVVATFSNVTANPTLTYTTVSGKYYSVVVTANVRSAYSAVAIDIYNSGF